MKQSSLHKSAMGFWIFAAIPTLLWMRESILWVAFMSLYANFVGHWSSVEAAKAKEESERSNGDNKWKKRLTSKASWSKPYSTKSTRRFGPTRAARKASQVAMDRRIRPGGARGAAGELQIEDQHRTGETILINRS